MRVVVGGVLLAVQGRIVHEEFIHNTVRFLVDAVVTGDWHGVDGHAVSEAGHGRVANHAELQTRFGHARGKQGVGRRRFAFR